MMISLHHLPAENGLWNIVVSVTKRMIEQSSFRGPEKLFEAVLPVGRLFLFGPCTTHQLDLPVQANVVCGESKSSGQ